MKKRRSMKQRFCRCIKRVQQTKRRGKQTKREEREEQRAIAICVTSVLQRRGRTLRRFRCTHRPSLVTQPLLHHSPP